MSDDKFGLDYDMDGQFRVADYRHDPNIYVTVATFSQVEALTLMWALEEHPERADQGYIDWQRQWR